MNLDDLKKAVPETPESFHKLLESEVAFQQESQKVIPIRRQAKGKTMKKSIAAAIAVAIILIPTLVYAGIKLSHRASVEPEGNYGAEIAFEVGTEAVPEETAQKADERAQPQEASETATLESASYTMPDPFPMSRMELDYIPEGMNWASETDHAHLIDPEDIDHRAFFFSGIAYDGGSLDDALLIKNVAESKVITAGDKEGVYIRLNDSLRGNPWNQRIYLLFPEQYRVLEMIFTDGISLEEALEVAGSVRYEMTGETIEASKLWTWSDMIEDLNHPEETFVLSEGLLADASLIHEFSLGETMPFTTYAYYDKEDHEQHLEVSLEDIVVADDISLLDPDYMIFDDTIREAADEDGNLLPAELSFVKMGDGVDTADTVVGTKTSQQKLVYLTVTFTNTGEENLEYGGAFLGRLFMLKQQEDGYYNVLPANPTGEAFSEVIRSNRFSYDRMYEMSYFDTWGAGGDGGNYLGSLAAGESQTIHLAYVVDEELLPYLYLELDPDGGLYFRIDQGMETNLFNIGQSIVND